MRVLRREGFANLLTKNPYYQGDKYVKSCVVTLVWRSFVCNSRLLSAKCLLACYNYKSRKLYRFFIEEKTFLNRKFTKAILQILFALIQIISYIELFVSTVRRMASRKCGRMFRPTAQWFNVGRLQSFLRCMSVGRIHRLSVELLRSIRSLQSIAMSWFAWQINRERSLLFHAESCGVGMTTFGVFGFMLCSAYRKPSSEHSKVCIELLDTFWVTQKPWPQRGGIVPSEVGQMTVRQSLEKRKTLHILPQIEITKFWFKVFSACEKK